MIYHFNLAYLWGMSGGDKCALEVIRNLSARGIDNTVITTEDGRETFIRSGLAEHQHCKYVTIADFSPSERGFSILLAYIRRTRAACRLMETLSPRDDDAIYCHNEFFPNLIPCNRLAEINPNAKLIYHLHMLAPDLWKGFTGQYTGRFRLPTPSLLHYRSEQALFRRRAKRRALILFNNEYYRDTLNEWFPGNSLYNIEHYSGIEIPDLPRMEKVYDLVWCGRFHEQKGVDQIPKIVALLKKRIPNIRLAVIGFGEKWNLHLRKELSRRGLEDNVELKGYLDGNEKYKVFKSSKIFLMTSLYESFGQVILEAMKCGLPVVAYDLPVYQVFKAGVVKVPPLDRVRMVEEIVNLLNYSERLEKSAEESLEFALQFSWRLTSDEVFDRCIATDKKLGRGGQHE